MLLFVIKMMSFECLGTVFSSRLIAITIAVKLSLAVSAILSPI